MDNSTKQSFVDEDASVKLARRVKKVGTLDLSTLPPATEIDPYADDAYRFRAQLTLKTTFESKDESSEEDEDMSVQPARHLGLGKKVPTFVPAANKQLQTPSTPKNTVSNYLEDKNVKLPTVRLRVNTI